MQVEIVNIEVAKLEERMLKLFRELLAAHKTEMINEMKEILPDFNQITYTREQFAKLLDISTKTLHDWLNKGKVQSQSYSNIGLFTHADYENLIKNPLYKLKNKRKKSYDIENMF